MLFRKKIITRDNGDPYLIRYYLLKTKYIRIVLHRILLSDDDCLHDHPWNFISLILKGGYFEKFEDVNGNIKYKWYGVFSLLFRKAEWKHSLRLAPGKRALTLVLMFKYKREWGFWTKNGWTH